MKPKGWRNESRRHSLASKGIKTAQKIPKMPKTKNPQQLKDEKTLKDIERVFKDKEKEIIEALKNSPDGQISISYGFVPAYRDWFGEDLDSRYMDISDENIEEPTWLFEEMEQRLGDKGISIIGDEGDGTVMWAMNEKGLEKYEKEMGW